MKTGEAGAEALGLRARPLPRQFDGWLIHTSADDTWTCASRRDLAIKGKDENLRRDMVAAYAAMMRHMPDSGVQVVMFTHQDADIWADLGAILWAAGLRVTGAWNIVTETESALKEAITSRVLVCLVLRKRLKEANARRMEIEADLRHSRTRTGNGSAVGAHATEIEHSGGGGKWGSVEQPFLGSLQSLRASTPTEVSADEFVQPNN